MKRRLYFQLITDSRDDERKHSKYTDRHDEYLLELKRVLVNICKFRVGNTETLNWDDGTIQLRTAFIIEEKYRGITWNKVMETINSVKPAYYEFIH